MGVYNIQEIRAMTVDQLYAVMADCGSPGYYQMAVEELQRRFLKEIESEVKRLADSSTRLERVTIWITGLTIALLLLTTAMFFRGS